MLLLALTASATCADLEEVARAVMAQRQVGTPMVEIYQAADSEVSKRLVRMAYDKPRYATEPRQKRAVQDFGDEVFARCLEAQHAN